jgi:membrane protein YdbS with pleckstrin-like domain
MAPIQSNHALRILARTAIAAAGPDLAEHMLSRRALKVNKTQQVTLGIIAVYVVVIALLWNIPYVRWSLWPFKVSPKVESLRSTC